MSIDQDILHEFQQIHKRLTWAEARIGALEPKAPAVYSNTSAPTRYNKGRYHLRIESYAEAPPYYEFDRYEETRHSDGTITLRLFTDRD